MVRIAAAAESYRGRSEIEREPRKNLKLVLRAKYDNHIQTI